MTHIRPTPAADCKAGEPDNYRNSRVAARTKAAECNASTNPRRKSQEGVANAPRERVSYSEPSKSRCPKMFIRNASPDSEYPAPESGATTLLSGSLRVEGHPIMLTSEPVVVPF